MEIEREIREEVFLFNRDDPRVFYDSALFFGQFPGMTGEDDYGPFEILSLRPIGKSEEDESDEEDKDSEDLEYRCGAYVYKRYTYNAISYVDTLVGHGRERLDRALVVLPSDPYQAAESWKMNRSGEEPQRIDDWWIKAGGGLALSLTKVAISKELDISSIANAYIRYPVSGLIAIMPDPTVVYEGEFWLEVLGEIAFKTGARMGGYKLAGAHAGTAIAVAKFVADVVVHVVQNDVVHSSAENDDLLLSAKYDDAGDRLWVEVRNLGPPIRNVYVRRPSSDPILEGEKGDVVPCLPTNRKTTIRFPAAAQERGLELVYTLIPYPGQAYQYVRNLDDLDVTSSKSSKKIDQPLVLEGVAVLDAGFAGPFNNTPSYQVVATVRNTSHRPVDLYLRSRDGEDYSAGWGDTEPELFAEEQPRLYAIGVEGRDRGGRVFRPIPSVYAWSPYTKTPSREALPNVCEIPPKETRSFAVIMAERFTPKLVRVFLRGPEEVRYDEVIAVGVLND